MRPELRSVLQSILNADMVERLVCGPCQDVLYAYIGAELDGENAAAIFPTVRPHLDQCEECRKEYEELQALLQMERLREFVEPPTPPAFDFSYLEATPRRHALWEPAESAGRQVARLFTEVRVLIDQQMASFDRLLHPLAPQWAPVPIIREKAAESRRRAQVLPLPSPDHDLSLSLTVGPVSGDEAALGVQITQMSSGKPLSRARITVRDENHRVLISELTHEDGRVTFPRLGSGSYVVEVKHRDRVWELPMTFTLAQEAMELQKES